MEYRKVVAIIRSRLLEEVEERLKRIGVKGMSVTHVKGFGEYKNVLPQDWFTTHIRIEIFAEKSKADKIAISIMEGAHTGGPGDGIICTLSVEKIYRIRTKSEAKTEDI